MTATDSSTDEAAAALAAADALVADGRHLEAIDLLTSANRAARHPRLEEQLVVVRHAAFLALDRRPPAGRPAPVTAATDDPGPLPEHGPEDLDVATLRSALSTHGCLLVRGLVPHERALELAAGIDRAIAGFDAAEAGTPIVETSPWYRPFRSPVPEYKVTGRRNWVRPSGGVLTADSPRMLFELLEVVEDTGVGPLIRAHLGERPALSAIKATLRRVPIDADTNWHQDGAFLGRDVRTLNLWLALSDCGDDAPGLDIVARRFDEVLPTGLPGAIFDWSVSPDTVAERAGGDQIVSPRFRPGDALLFDQLLLHRTAISPSMTRERHAIESWFFAPSAYPDGGIPVLC